MNALFEFDGQNVTLNPIVLSIKEFEKIWKRDKTKDKSKARKELIYIYGMVSTNEDNIWKDYVRIDEREKMIITDLYGKDSAWVPDRLIQDAMEKYKARYPKTAAELLLESSMLTMMKVRDYLDDIDLNERDSMGKPIHNPKMMLDASKQAVKTFLEIEDIIQKVKNNKNLKNDKIRGGSQQGLFEDPDAVNNMF